MVDHGSNSDGHGPMISQINGRTLLLFYYGNVNMGYQIVTYKDITDERTKFLLPEDQMPTHWYNLTPDLPTPLPPR